MKKTVFSVVATCCFLGLVGATAQAQLPGTELRATIPFDFSIRGKTLPAGDYEIKRLTDKPDVLIVSSKNNHEREVFETEADGTWETPNHGELVFHRYGDRYFLSEVFGGGGLMGRELLESRDERNLKREMAASSNNNKRSEPETVALAVY